MAFTSFNAVDIPSLAVELNAWSADQEHAFSELRNETQASFAEVIARIEQSVSALRNETQAATSPLARALLQPNELQEIGNSIVRLEQGQAQQAQTGNLLVAELQDQFNAFRLELADRQAKQIKADEEIRGLTSQLQVKFIEIETTQQQYRQQDKESLQTDLRTLVGKLDELTRKLEARFVTIETRLNALSAEAPEPRGSPGPVALAPRTSRPPTDQLEPGCRGHRL